MHTYLHHISSGNLGKAPSNTTLGYMEDPLKWLTKARQKETHLVEIIDEQLRPQLVEVEELRKNSEIIVNSCTLSLKHLKPLRLLNAIDREVTHLTNETNRFLLAKTPILLNELIDENDAPFIFEKMGSLFRHIMIDEFQDTSSIQWENFKSLMMETMSTGGGNLLVGDVKQSIYRWRGGDWSILNEIEQRMMGTPLHVKNLDTNRRSEQQIGRAHV